MAARIEVIGGPDVGWRFTVVGTGARMGRGPGHQIRLTDRHWPDGDVGIQPRPGGYVVTNNLPHPVYLDGRPLSPGSARTLHHGATLQPTAETLLRLRIVAPPPGADGVVSEPPPEPRRGFLLRLGPWMLLGAFAAHQAQGYFTGPPRLDAAAAAGHKEALARIGREPWVDPLLGAELRFVHLRFTSAVYHDSADRYADAAREYQEVRDGLTRVRRIVGPLDATGARAVPESDRSALLAVERFAETRLKATARGGKKKAAGA